MHLYDQKPQGTGSVVIEEPPASEDYMLPEIDLNNWKVTLPLPRSSDGKPTEVSPPEILNYATNKTLLPFMYNDSTDGSIVFLYLPLDHLQLILLIQEQS